MQGSFSFPEKKKSLTERFYCFASSSQVPDLKVSLCLSLGVFFGDVLAFVVKFFTSREANLHFYQAAFQVDFQGHDGVAFHLDLIFQLADLRLVEKELSGAQGIFVENVSFFVGTDVHVLYQHFPTIDGNEGFFDAAFAHAEGFHLGAVKSDACLVFFVYKIIMVCLLVVRNQADVF